MGEIEAVRHRWWKHSGTKTRQSTGSDRNEGRAEVVSRLSGAIIRAVLVAVVVATPSVLLFDISGDTRQMVALAALFAGLLAFVEYNAEYPSLIEFRDAPPFNRLRFLMLFATLFSLSMIERGRTDPTSLTEFIHAIGQLIGMSMDFPYSPVRLATLMLDSGASAEQVNALRDAAGVAYLTSLVCLSIFVIMLKAGAWPLPGRAFNVWINLPTFDPTAGGDVIERLERDGRINIALGFLLPFVTPFVVSSGFNGLNPNSITAPQTLIWTMALWSFLPASLFMRGIALGRLADMIRDIRRARDAEEGRLATA